VALADALREGALLLDALGHRWCVVGGLAVAARTPARFTLDVDLAVEVASDADAEATTVAFLEKGWTLCEAHEHEALDRLASVRLQREGLELDLLFALCGIEGEVVEGASRLDVLPGLSAWVASLGHLVAMKLLAIDPRRPRDAQDLVALLQRAAPADLAVARSALESIARVGAARGRPLTDDLDRWLVTVLGA
jgi:hypothetical protein